ncbi:hypothetical protein L6164_033964 [Bauhinia variegata]|uniref:Uncharacterized protein n=1 Tax=Bauhinia variegata TaxID=167791 RepID=A0ACB9KTF8_BAUVA|nr:hypothetical protein L6164_033964 [Bauhinia variegata]
MPREIFLRPASSDRRQPLLKSRSCCSNTRVGEVVGSTTAECAAVCCCCPCALANFLVLAFYKVPACLCRRVLKKKRLENLGKKGLMPPKRHASSCSFDEDFQIPPLYRDSLHCTKSQKSLELDKEAEQLEKEMWERFYSTGFWRSTSQKESSTATSAASSQTLTNVKPLSQLNRISH